MKKAKVINCKHFKSCGNVFGYCKKLEGGCRYKLIDDCRHSERKYKIKKTKTILNESTQINSISFVGSGNIPVNQI